MAKIRWNDQWHPLPDIVYFRHLLVCFRGDYRECVVVFPWRPYDAQRENISFRILNKKSLIVLFAVSSVGLEEAFNIKQPPVFDDSVLVRCLFEDVIISGVERVGILIGSSLILHPKRNQFPASWNNFIDISV